MLYISGLVWLMLGIGAIVMAVFNIILTIKGKDAKVFRFISLSLTALALCAFYSQNAVWVLNKDWSALQDVVPSMSVILWVVTLVSIALNSVSLFRK